MLFALLVPLLFLAVFLAAAVRRVRVYDSFASGVAGVLPLLKSLLPYITAVLILAELFEASGLSALLSRALTPAFNALGIPAEVAQTAVRFTLGPGVTAEQMDTAAHAIEQVLAGR